jgi:hypothetical protein
MVNLSNFIFNLILMTIRKDPELNYSISRVLVFDETPYWCLSSNLIKSFKHYIPSIGVSLHRWGDFTQSLKFKFLYKSHCKSSELLWVSYFMMFLKSPQQFAVFAVTLVKKFKF